jgi:c-di-GMP-related signal transduction protein
MDAVFTCQPMQTPHTELPGDAMTEMAVARQPIVDGQRMVLAYELFHRIPASAAHPSSGRAPLALSALVENGASFATSKTDLFFGCQHSALSGPHWDLLDPAKIVIDVPLVREPTPAHVSAIAALLAQLRGRGFRLAFDYGVVAPVYQPWHHLVDFVRVDLSSDTQAQIRNLLGAIGTRTGADVIAHNIQSAEQFELFKGLGVKRFQGAWFSEPEIVQSRVLSPVETNALKLFNMVRKDTTSLDAVELLLKKDAELGVSLLRIINSAATGLRQPVTSLRQAVQLMGYQKLGRWAALLMASASQGSTSLLGASSVVRGRMMELLALHRLSDAEAGAAFLVGLLSQIDQMLGSPMDVLVDQLGLEPDVSAALRSRSGRFGAMLDLVVACEQQDDLAFQEAFVRLDYTNHQVNMAHMEALIWCDNVG